MTAIRSSENGFKDSISTGVTLVDFNAPWCEPCREQETILKALEKDYRKTARVTLLNIDENREIAFTLGIQSIPTIIIYKDGAEINRFIGLQTGDTLGNALKQLVDEPIQ